MKRFHKIYLEISNICTLLVIYFVCFQCASCDEPSFVEKTENSLQRAYNATERGVTKAAKATANGIEKGAKATEKTAKKVVNKISSTADKVGEKIGSVFE